MGNILFGIGFVAVLLGAVTIDSTGCGWVISAVLVLAGTGIASIGYWLETKDRRRNRR